MPAALTLSLAACTGQIDIAESRDSGQENRTPDGATTPEAGNTPPFEAGPGTGGDAGDVWDGWSSGFASKASGPPPACASAPLACGAAFPGETPFATSQDAANALVGRWSFCGQATDFPSPGQVGEEYAADGTYYSLVMGPNGQMQRNLDPAYITHWQVDLIPGGGIEFHTGGVQQPGGLSACPPSLVLSVVEARIP